MITATDFFCGMGGSSTGLVEAGFTVKLAANHWARAIETHSANHPDTEHLCADISNVDLRYLPRTRALWARKPPRPVGREKSGGFRPRKSHMHAQNRHIRFAAHSQRQTLPTPTDGKLPLRAV